MSDGLAPEHPAPIPLDARVAYTLPSEDREAQIMWWMRYRIARVLLEQHFTSARLRTILVVCLSLFFWFGLFALFYEGFQFVDENVGKAGTDLHADTISFVFHLFFASLNVMLIFSTGIILNSGLYGSPDTRHLLTLPIRPERIVIFKFQEALLFSSWGFFLLASPMMIAYGMVVSAPWYYYAMLLPLIVAFVYIPCGLGALCCLWIVYKLPHLRKAAVGLSALIVIVVATSSIWQTISGPQSSMFGTEWFQETFKRFEVTQYQLLPSSWLTGGLLEAAREPSTALDAGRLPDMPIVQSCLYLLVLISNALLCHILIFWAARRWFRTGYSGYRSRYQRRTSARISLVDQIANNVLFPFSKQTRLLLIKDWRLLRRDPVQWSQFLIFFGLLGLYFLNIDRFRNPGGNIDFVTWINMVSFLNLAVVGLILSTFTTRFIYPMISLEGQCFWVLGLLPVERDTILWSKFLFASIGSWFPCSLLILISDMMLRVSTLVILLHQLTCILLCLGLASFAVGLGAMMPNFTEHSPSKIAAGFGGTLNLVLSALYIIAIVVLTALPSHFYLIADRSSLRDSILGIHNFRIWLVIGVSSAMFIGLLATVLPLRWGLKAFRRLEFC